MFKNHPKGLFVAFFTNMGERFGFYTMVAIFTLFLQAKYGMSEGGAGQVYSIFIAAVYLLTVLGGIIADRVLGYAKTISIGIVVMFCGYLLLALPTAMGSGLWLIIAGLSVIAFGTGLFKGNLQALVGNLYDDPRYSANRDRAFNIFYMGINIGAMFAPLAGTLIYNWILKGQHFFYNNRIPALANIFLRDEPAPTGLTSYIMAKLAPYMEAAKSAFTSNYLEIAQKQDASVTVQTLKDFSGNYLNALSKAYHFAFGVACISLIASILVFWIFRKHYLHADFSRKKAANAEATRIKPPELTREQVRQRLTALGLVFLVVIFFWMSFHQNAVCQTYFARDYTQSSVSKLTYIWFDIFALLAIFLSLLGLYFLLKKGGDKTSRAAGAVAFIGFAVLAYLRYSSFAPSNRIQPQIFQQLNPFFIVALTPLVISFFSYLNRRGKEPSAPRKIGMGMVLAAMGFGLLIFASLKLGTPTGQVAPESMLISPYWLIGSYFTLTIAELFLSPMGISFVSRVSPPKYKGMMQGFWFAATAIGNYLVGIIAGFWRKVPLWSLWSILVFCCLLSAAFMFSIMKRLDRATKNT